MKVVIFVTVFLALGLGITVSCSDVADSFTGDSEKEFTLEHIQGQLSHLDYSVQLAGFDYMACNYEHSGPGEACLIHWKSAQKIVRESEMIWEVPVYSRNNTAIVAGKRAGQLLKAVVTPASQRILFKKNTQTGESSYQLLTLIASDLEGINSSNLQNLEGFFILSDLNGQQSVTYKVEKGVMKKILAGNADLQLQNEDFYCFCFQEGERKEVCTRSDSIFTSIGGSIGGGTCDNCGLIMEVCKCKRCPDCGNIPESCSCNVCHICGEPHTRCQCAEKCPGCHEYTWNCECPKEPIPVEPSVCPFCAQQHTGGCESSSEPSVGGKCTNIYCTGGEQCNCRSMGCPCAILGGCSCPSKVTT